MSIIFEISLPIHTQVIHKTLHNLHNYKPT